jgi:hypothetical protein
VDRVLARSEAKTDALVEIVSLEHRNLGDRLRMLVLSDHEKVSSVLPVDLHEVMPPEAGSASLALERLLQDPVTAGLAPLLVTGSRVAGAPETLEQLRTMIAAKDRELADALRVEAAEDIGAGAATLTGRWTSSHWVPWVTRFFEAGRAHVLVGTRALLGEGWDAPAVTGLVDLTTATSSTAVVQTRGRALRLDPAWPDKVAITWSVVCVTDTHPKGEADWDRFVRKHQGFYGVDEQGAVVDGVAHVHDSFSPYAAPAIAELDACNAAMIVRAEQRSQVRDRWRVGEPYADTHVHTLRVLPARAAAQTPAEPVPDRPGRASVVLREDGLDLRAGAVPPWRPHVAAPVGAVVAFVLMVLWGTPGTAVAVAALVGALVQGGVAAGRGRTHLRTVARPPSVARVACAVADALCGAELTSAGAERVRVEVDAEGEYRCALDGVSPEESARFVGALDEVLSPMAAPRYVLPRYSRPAPSPGLPGLAAGLAAALGRARPSGEVWHSVPSVLATRAEHAKVFAQAWDDWVGGGDPVYTHSPRGEGIVVTHRGSDPFDATTMLRVHWR